MFNTIQTKKMPRWMKRNGRLPLNSEIQSATFITRVRLSFRLSLMSRETLCRRSRAVSRRRLPVALRRSIAAAGRMRMNSLEIAAIDDQRIEILGDQGGRHARAAVEQRHLPEKVTSARRLEHDALAGVVLEEELHLSRAHYVERVAGVAAEKERLARRRLHTSSRAARSARSSG